VPAPRGPCVYRSSLSIRSFLILLYSYRCAQSSSPAIRSFLLQLVRWHSSVLVPLPCHVRHSAPASRPATLPRVPATLSRCLALQRPATSAPLPPASHSRDALLLLHAPAAGYLRPRRRPSCSRLPSPVVAPPAEGKEGSHAEELRGASVFGSNSTEWLLLAEF
jgi:hypothetical protein